MRRLALISSLLTGLVVSVIAAIAGAPGVIQQYNAVCDPNSPTHCAAPDSSGNIPITGSISSTTAATATAADPSYIEGSSNPVSQDLAGALRTRISQATPGTTNGVSVAYIGSTAVASGSGVMNGGTQRVALATDSPGIVATSTVVPGTAPGQALVAGCIYNSSLPSPTNGQTMGIQCDANGRLIDTPQPTTAGGLSVYFVQPTASDNHANIKNGVGQVYKVSVTNNSATINYLRLYNAASGFNGCNSATNLVYQMAIPASTSGAGYSDSWDLGMAFSTGISICVTSGYATNDTTNATASAMSVNIGYK